MKYPGSYVWLAALAFISGAWGQTNVTTNRYNTARTAANLNETQLTAANVNTSTFGKLGTYTVDGVIYAQPLYVQGVTIAGALHNALYVGTMHDVMYAFDADNVGSAPLWTLDFRNAAAGISAAPCNCQGNEVVVADTIGIFGTPVIDLPNNRMFFVTDTLEKGTEYFRLRSVDIRTGALLGSTQVTGSVPAAGSAAAETFISGAGKYVERPALELAGGQVWVAFGSRPPGDYTTPYEGWVMTYNPNTLTQTGVFATSRTNGNSIWQSGSGPAVDANGNVYYLTANGGYYDGATDFPESLLKMSFVKSLTLNDWYTPDGSTDENYVFMDTYDLDLSCNGPVLIPGTDLVAFGSKTADVFVLHTGVSLGHLTPNDTQLAQFFHVGAIIPATESDSDRVVGMAYWQRANGGILYVWPGQDALHAFTLNTATALFSQTYAGSLILPGQPGTALALSANGGAGGTGILWAPVMQTAVENNVVGQPGILHAYNAENLNQELWNSNMSQADAMGTLAKFVPPVVVNGKVFMANSANVADYSAGSVTVYGLKAPPSLVSLSGASNVYGIFNNGTAPTHGGLDNSGNAYSANLLGTSVTWSGVTFPLGAAGAADAVTGGTVSLPAGSFASLKLLATAVNGNQTNQSFVVTYADGTTSTFVQSVSDWGTSENYSGEAIATTMAYRVTASGGTQSGSWHLYGYSFALNSSKTVKSITLPNTRHVVTLAMALLPVDLQPGVIGVSPDAGTGTAQTFSATYFDPNGAAGLTAAYFLASTAVMPAHGCYVQYYPPSGLLFMENDAGTGYVPPAKGTPLGSAKTLSNSQCSVSVAGASYAVSGNTATLTLPITFKAAAAANIYLFAAEKNGTNSGWVQAGAWGGNAMPVVVSVSPDAGTGTTQTFTATYADANGGSQISAAYLLFSSALQPSHDCYVQYYPPSGLLFLENDAGTGYVPPATGAPLGSATTLANSQCSVSAAGTTYTVSGSTANLIVPITFSGTAATNIYLFAAELDGTNSSWVQQGTWTP